MKNLNRRNELILLDRRANVLRFNLGFSVPNRQLYRAEVSASAGRILLVEADGLGGAWASMIGGNHPFDYQLYYERYFDTELEAVRAAKDIAELEADPEIVLQPSGNSPPRIHAQCSRRAHKSKFEKRGRS
jgi:hypothetical protein